VFQPQTIGQIKKSRAPTEVEEPAVHIPCRKAHRNAPPSPLSSRPKRSEVEGSAVHQTPHGNVFKGAPMHRRFSINPCRNLSLSENRRSTWTPGSAGPSS